MTPCPQCGGRGLLEKIIPLTRDRVTIPCPHCARLFTQEQMEQAKIAAFVQGANRHALGRDGVEMAERGKHRWKNLAYELLREGKLGKL